MNPNQALPLSRAQALEELLTLEVQLTELARTRTALQDRHTNLKRFVLGETIKPQAQPSTRPVAGHTRRYSRGAGEAACLRVLREHGGGLTAADIATLLGDTTHKLVGQTLIRLRHKHFVHSEKPARVGQAMPFNVWTLSVHPDANSLAAKEPA